MKNSTFTERGRALAGALLATVAFAGLVALITPRTGSAQAAPRAYQAPAGYAEEWVYRVKLGHEAEFWRVFQKTQLPVLDREKELGEVLEYRVYRPGLHVAGAARWSYRVIVTYKDAGSPSKSSAIEKALFPDRAAYERDETRRWDLVEDHYDLPIHETDPHTAT